MVGSLQRELWPCQNAVAEEDWGGEEEGEPCPPTQHAWGRAMRALLTAAQTAPGGLDSRTKIFLQEVSIPGRKMGREGDSGRGRGRGRRRDHRASLYGDYKSI